MLLPLLTALLAPRPAVTFDSLLAEMTNPAVLAELPSLPYESRQASNYNRGRPTATSRGWFTDSDGVGFIRLIETAGQKEWVMMEHEGPRCLTEF